MANDRFVMVGTTDHPHEQEGLVFARSVLPNFDAWALFDLLERSGRSYEVDLLVIGYAAIYLVELKHYGGIIDGDTRDWEWTPDGVTRPLIRPAPFSLTNQKSKVLRSQLEQFVERFPVPYVQPVVFLSNPNVEIRLRGEARRAVVGQDGLARAISHAELPDVDASRFRPISAPLRRELIKAFGKLGIKPRKGMLRAGSYVLGSVFEEGEGFQDREAHHEQLPNIVHRARVYLVPQQTTAEHRQRLTRAAEREVQLLHLARENPGVLHSTSYVADGPLGPTLLFEDFEGGISLDRFVVREPPSFAEKFEILKQIGYTLEHCHNRNVHHGGLCPQSVLVRRRDSKLEAKLFNFQLGGSEEHSVTSHRSSLAQLLGQAARLYQAPELEQNPTATSPSTDTFSLGALAYWLFTDKAPADNPTELTQKLQRDQCLDPSAVSDALPESLIDGIIEATRLEARISSPRDFVVLVQDRLAAEQAAIAPSAESTEQVLEADKGDILIERFEVVRVLGIGSSARVLEVKDGPESYALKVSRNAEQDDRLTREAAILRELDDPCIVRLHEELPIGGRRCLLLSLAGDRSLRQLIAEEGTLDLDLGSRYGEDLLRALEALEEKDKIHRDIKPANLGVGSRRKGLARHLTLFDFSLASAALDDLEVGTAPYRDPWLKSQGRGQWDHAADRWSAAITLHEMLTGVRPEFTPRGISPLATNAKLEIMAERFDASNRDRLIKFFEKALAREVGDRFASASLMLRSWAACFDETVRLAPTALAIEPNKEDRRGGAVHLGRATPEQIAAIRPTTEIHALPLSVRAINALDRAGLHVAEELLALPNNRVSAIRGVGTKVLGEILDVRNRWREQLGAEAEVATTSEPFYPDYRGSELELAGLSDVDQAVAGNLEDAGLRTSTALARAPKVQVEAIVTRNAGDCARLHATLVELDTRRTSDTLPATLDAWIAAVFPATDKAGKRLRMLFGLEPPYLGVAGVRLQDVADHESISRQRMHQVLAAAIDRWQLQPWRSELRSLALDIVDALGGVATLDDAIVALSPQLACEAELAPTLHDARLAALLRVAPELAPADDEPTLVLRRSDRQGATILWLLIDPELWPTIQQLGRRADQLAQREPLAATGETTRILRDMVEDTPLAKLDASRLLDLAAAASRGAARSSRLELYPIGMPAERALALSAQALSTPKLTATQIHSRVRARYPEALPLPDRPALDRLLADYQFTFDEAQDAYVRAQSSTEVNTTSTTSFQRFETVQPPTPQPLPRARDEESLTAWEFEDVLRGVRQDRKLRVLGVKSTRVPEALIGLERAFGVRAIAIDQRLITTMEHVIVAKGGKPAALPRADALGPTGPSWKLLLRTAGEAAEQLAAELLPPVKPLLLVQLGLLARYGLAEFLAKLVAAANDDRSEAIVLVNAVHGDDRLDVIANTLTIPGLLAGQLTKIPREWIENRHRGSVPPA